MRVTKENDMTHSQVFIHAGLTQIIAYAFFIGTAFMTSNILLAVLPYAVIVAIGYAHVKHRI